MFHFLILLVAFVVCWYSTKLLIPVLKRCGVVGRDMNKPDKPEIAEMGGIAIVFGFAVGIMLALALNTFFGMEFNIVFVMASVVTVLLISIIGVADDLIDLPQYIKAFSPVITAIPLVVVKAAGSTAITIPFLGIVDFGVFYVVVFIPLAIAVCSNLTNMLAGFNGVESGMGVIMFLTLSILALSGKGSPEMAILSVSMLGALAGFFLFNSHPAQIFPGDIGNLTIGAVLASAVIIGNLETAGVILMLPYIVEFGIKMFNRFPSKDWWGKYRNGKLFPIRGKVRGLGQLFMKLYNGIEESRLVTIFLFVEWALGMIVLIMFAKV